MPQHQQPNSPRPRISYRDERRRLHPMPWATDQGVPSENDPNPDWSNLRIPQSKPHHERIRSEPWKRGEEDIIAPQTCVPKCFVTTSTDSDEGQTIYLQQDTNPVVYYAHQSESSLAFVPGAVPPACGGATPSAITGQYNPIPNSPMFLRVWWNIFVVCGAPPPDTSSFSLINNGTCDLDVNGTLLHKGDRFDFSGLDQAPFNGDMHVYPGGTVFTVTVV